MRATLPNLMLLVAGVVVCALQALGVFQSIDARVLGAAAELRATDRGSAPLVVALDDRMNDRWGPPPWSPAQWDELASALADVGIPEAVLVDPAERVVQVDPEAAVVVGAPGPPAEPARPRARVLVPTRMFQREDGSWLASSLGQAVGPLEPWDAHLALPAHTDGVVRDLRSDPSVSGQFGPSAFCSWAPFCPPEGELAVPIRSSALRTLPTVSASALLNGHVRLPPEEASARLVIVGLTGSAWAHRVPAGPEGGVYAFPVAVGAAVSSAVDTHPASLWPWPRVLALLVLIGLSSIAAHRALDGRGRTAYVLVAPGVVGAASIAGFLRGWMVPPVTASLLLVLLPAALAHLAERARFLGFIGHVRQLLELDDLRHVPRAHPLRTPDELLTKLGALTRTYLKAERCALLLVDGDAVSFAGGFGLTEADLRLPERLDRGAWSRVVRRPQVGETVPELMVDPAWKARVVPLLEGDRLLGFWVIPFTAVVGPPAPASIAELMRWLHPRLQVLSTQRDRGWLPDGLEDQIGSALELVSDSVTERRAQLDVLRHLAWPLLVADVSGEVIETNLALQRLLRDTDLAAVASIRELLFRVRGEGEVSALCARLFTGREQLALPWSDSSGRAFEVRVRPIESSEQELQGFVAMIQDTTAQERVKHVRTQALAHASAELTRHLDALTELGTAAPTPIAAAMRDRLSGLRFATEELQAVAGFETELEEALPSNVAGLLHLALEELEPVRARKQIVLDVVAPAHTRPAHVVPAAARRVLAELLLNAIRTSPRGSRVRVSVVDGAEGTEIDVEWPGAGLDESVLAVVNTADAAQHAHLPPHLAVFGRLREVFEAIEVRRTEGLGAAVHFRAPRVVRR